MARARVSRATHRGVPWGEGRGETSIKYGVGEVPTLQRHRLDSPAGVVGTLPHATLVERRCLWWLCVSGHVACASVWGGSPRTGRIADAIDYDSKHAMGRTKRRRGQEAGHPNCPTPPGGASRCTICSGAELHWRRSWSVIRLESPGNGRAKGWKG